MFIVTYLFAPLRYRGEDFQVLLGAVWVGIWCDRHGRQQAIDFMRAKEEDQGEEQHVQDQ